MWALPAVNWMAILLAGIVQMAVGFLWYSPMLFGAAWMKLSGIKPISKKAMPMLPMVWMFLGTLLTAFVMANMINYAGAKGALLGAVFGFFIWLGFFVPGHASSVLFEGKPLKLYLLNVGHYLVGIVLAGAVLGHFA